MFELFMLILAIAFGLGAVIGFVYCLVTMIIPFVFRSVFYLGGCLVQGIREGEAQFQDFRKQKGW